MKRFVVAAVCCLSVSSAVQVGADCGWMLWVQRDSPGSKTFWNFEAATSTFESCQAELRTALAETTKEGSSYRIAPFKPNLAMRRHDDGGFIVNDSFRYMCLPSSFDPRPRP